MAIQVSCPSCKTKFTVSDQFAGKQGPCPKCKAKITIPKQEAKPGAETKPAAKGAGPGAAKPGAAAKAGAAPVAQPGASPAGKARPQAAPRPGAKAAGPTDASSATKPAPAPLPEVKIHAPDSEGPKSVTGRSVTKPIARTETTIRLVPTLIIVASVLTTMALARIARAPLEQHLWLRAVGLLCVSGPLVAAAYSFLRDDELEPYRGKSLYLRAAACGLVYMALWGAYFLVPADWTSETYSWVFLAPPFFLIGAGAAYALLDLDPTNSFFHYCFYVLLTLALGWLAGLQMPWSQFIR